jgi:hypothetical protein
MSIKVKLFLAFVLTVAMSKAVFAENIAMGEIIDAGENITLQIFNTPSSQSSIASFKADKPLRYEMTTGLKYLGHAYPGQIVCIIYNGDLLSGNVSILLFNPEHADAANFKTSLGEKSGKDGRFISKDGRFAFVFTPDTIVTDSNGESAVPCEGQDILVWFDSSRQPQSGDVVLSKAVVLLTREEGVSSKDIRVYANGDVCLDDGPLARLEPEQLEMYYLSCALPVRLMAESMGFAVNWEPDGSIALKKDGLQILFDIGSSHYKINNQFAKLAKGEFFSRMGVVMADSSFISELAGLSKDN